MSELSSNRFLHTIHTRVFDCVFMACFRMYVSAVTGMARNKYLFRKQDKQSHSSGKKCYVDGALCQIFKAIPIQLWLSL